MPNVSDCITFRDVYKKITPNAKRYWIYGWVDARNGEWFDDELEVIINLKLPK